MEGLTIPADIHDDEHVIDIIDEDQSLRLDIERVLEANQVNELYCPNCCACITNRIIIRRERRIRNLRRTHTRNESHVINITDEDQSLELDLERESNNQRRERPIQNFRRTPTRNESSCIVELLPSSYFDPDSLSIVPFKKRDPVMLISAARNESTCIYQVPPSLRKMDRKYFDPDIVSIGPLHHGCNKYDLLEKHKARYFDALITRSHLQANDYFKVVNERLDDIKSCYLQIRDYKEEDLVKMIVIDGCFILEMFRIVKRLVKELGKSNKSTDCFNTAEVFPFLLRDFMLLENQIPFFVLQLLFNKSKTDVDGDHTLVELALNFFGYAMPKPLQFGKLKKDFDASKVKHLLDLLLLSVTKFAPEVRERQPQDWDAYRPRIPSATKLGLGGISINRRTSDSFISIGFNNKKGILKIPPLVMDEFISAFISNCVAFENFHPNSTMHFSTYVYFMRCLNSKEADAEFLSNQRILDNYLGTDADVVEFFNTLASGVSAANIQGSYMANMFYQVNTYYESKWHQTWAEFWQTYLGSPWIFLSASAVLIGLLLTAIQTHYAISP